MYTFFGETKTELLSLVIYGVAYIMALFIAMPFHEFAHAWVAKKEGDYTATALKRCTLAPHAHIDPIGFLFLVFAGFGWAKPVPIDARNFKRGKLSKFLVAIAGIVMNLILGTVFLFIYVLIIKIDANFYTSCLYGQLLKEFLNLSVVLNYALAFFNLLPIYPLDGFRIVETFSKYDNAFLAFMRRNSMFIFFIVLISSLFTIYIRYTAGVVIELLLKLFITILGV